MGRWFLAVCLTVMGATAGAQTMYKCGTTFSQTPCAPDAKEVRAAGVPQPVVAPPLPAATPQREAELAVKCHLALRDIPAWKDRESLRIEPPSRGREAVVRDINGVRRPVIPYYTTINARNSYGGYTGEKAAACYFDMAEERIVDLTTDRFNPAGGYLR